MARHDTVHVSRIVEASTMITKDEAVLGGEPVFKGTRIPVHGIAAMLAAGASEADVLEGYPKLDARMLDMARLWAEANPEIERPKRLEALGVKPTATRRVAMKADPLAKTMAPQD